VVSPRVRRESVHPRLKSGAFGRPLNFTVRLLVTRRCPMSKHLLLLWTAFFACSAVPQEQGRRASDLVGTWVGRWDNKWCVQFTVTADSDFRNATVLYEFEENIGKPLHSLRRVGPIDGTRLQIQDPLIEIFLSATPDQAVAFGHFSTPRSAVLVRESTRRCAATGGHGSDGA